MKLKYIGEGLKGVGLRFVKGNTYDINSDVADELIKRGGFEIVKETKFRNIGLEQQAFVEKAIKNTKREGR